MAWDNLKNIFDPDIFIESIAIFAKTFFKFVQNLRHGIMLRFVMNVLCFVLMVCLNQNKASVECTYLVFMIKSSANDF